jgi:hypothetical protein
MGHTADIHQSNDGTAAVPAGQAHTDRAGDAFAGSGVAGGDETVRAGRGDGAALDGTLVLGDPTSGAIRAQQIQSRTLRAVAYVEFVGPAAPTLDRVGEAVAFDSSGGACTANLPDVATVLAGTRYWIKNKATGSNTVTIDPFGAQLIDGVATLALLPGQAAVIIADGTGWQVFAAKEGTSSGLGEGSILVWGNDNVAAAADSRSLNFGSERNTASVVGSQPGGGTESAWRAPRPGIVRNMRVRHNAAVGNGNPVVYTLTLNGVATTLTASLASGALGDASNLVAVVIVITNDLVTMVASKALSIGAGGVSATVAAELV